MNKRFAPHTRSARRPRGRTFVFLGISGSGKGTYAELMKHIIPGVRQISTGEHLRAAAKKDTLMGQYVREILDRGGIVPFWAAAYGWMNQLFEHLHGDEDLLFDGSPRMVEEAWWLDEVSAALGREPPAAVYVRVRPAVARERLLKRGRSDDNPRAIAGRFAFFRTYVRRTIRYYRERGRLIVVDGNRPVELVWNDVRRGLKLG